jgi:hypothetical protein
MLLAIILMSTWMKWRGSWRLMNPPLSAVILTLF